MISVDNQVLDEGSIAAYLKLDFGEYHHMTTLKHGRQMLHYIDGRSVRDHPLETYDEVILLATWLEYLGQ